MKKKGISLVYLIVVIVVMLVIAAAIIATVSRNNPIGEANDLVVKSAMQKMIDDRNTRYKELLADNFGDESRIKDSDFNDIIPSDYVEQQFYATKQGIVYRGEDEKTRELAKEMGILITDKEIMPGIKDIILSSGTSNINVNLKLESSASPITDFRYMISNDGVSWKTFASEESIFSFQQLQDKTNYKIKVKIQDENGNENESEVRDIATKELLVGSISLKLENKNGKNYTPGRWTNKNIYAALIQSSTGSSSYEVKGATNIANGTQSDTTLVSEGESVIVVTTTDGTNTKTGAEIPVNIDKTPPSFALNIDKITTNDVSTSLSDISDTLSGVEKHEFYIDGVKKAENTDTTFKFGQLTQGTTHNIKVVLADKAENKKVIQKDVVIAMIPDANDTVNAALTPATWTNTDVTLTLRYIQHGVDGLVGQYSEDGDNYTDVNDFHTVIIPYNKEVYVRYRDSENQTGPVKKIAITNIDKQKPLVTMNPNGGQYAIPTGQSQATLKTYVTARDIGDSGLKTVQYAWSMSKTVEPTTGWINFNASGQEIVKNDATKGTWYLWTKVVDNASNRAESIKVSDEFGLGEPKISLKPNPSGWTSGNVTVAVEYGGALTQNKKAGIQGSTLVADATSVLATSQGQVVYAEATDTVGNKVTATLKIANIDRVKPTTTISPNGGQYVIPTGKAQATLKAKLTATDTQSGLKTVQYAWNQSPTTEPVNGWVDFNGAGQDITKTDATEGTWYLWMKVMDQVGNQADTIKVSNGFVVNNNTSASDNTIILTPSTVDWTNQDVEVTVQYGRHLSQNRKAGIQGGTLQPNATQITATQQDHVAYAEATDIAGNKVIVTLQIRNIDKVNPIAKISPNGGHYVLPTGKTEATIKARLAASDAASGLATVQYAWADSSTMEPREDDWLEFAASGQDIEKTNATEGNWYLWTRVLDVAGNRATDIKVSQVFAVNRNGVDPLNSIVLQSRMTDWTNQDVEVTVAYGANLPNNRKSGVGAATTAGAKKVIVTKQNDIVYAQAEDIAGNKVIATLQVSNIDKEKPTTAITPNGGQYLVPTGSNASTLKARLTAQDHGDSGLKTVQYAWAQSNTAEPVEGWSSYNAAGQDIVRANTPEGTWYLWTKVVDKASNRAENIKVSNAFVVNDPDAEANRIDITPNTKDWTNQNVIGSIRYGQNITNQRKAGIQGQTLSDNATSVTVTTQNQVIYAEGTDAAGNKVTASLQITNIDKEKPTTTITPNGGQYVLPTGSQKATIKTRLTAADTGGSTLKTVQYAWSQSSTLEPLEQEWKEYNAAGEEVIHLEATEGNWYVWTRVVDIAGNRAENIKVSAAFVVNNSAINEANKIVLVPSTTEWITGNVDVTVKYGTNLSKNRKAGLQGGSMIVNATKVTATAQNQVVYAEATDVAGNKVTASLKITNIDRIEPTTTISPNGGNYVLPTGSSNATLKARLTAADHESGLQTVEYTWSQSNVEEPSAGWTTYQAAGQDIVKTNATEGNWYLWTRVLDKVGNRASNIRISRAFTVNNHTSNANNIILTPSTTAWTNNNVTVRVAYGENLPLNRKAGIGSATTANGTSFTVTQQNQVVYAEATDAAGNKVTASLKVSNIDKIAPTTTISPDGGQYIVPTGKTAATLKAKVTATDTGGSSLKTVQYAWSNTNLAEPSEGWVNYTAAGQDISKTDATPGKWYLWTKVIDTAGNRAENLKVSAAFVVNDPNAEASKILLTADKTAWTNGNVQVSVKYGANISQNRKAGIQNGTLTPNLATVLVTEQHQIAYAEGTDVAGNKVTATLQISNIDKIKPTTTIAPNGGQYVIPTGKTQATIKARLTANDTGGSNLKTVQYAWSQSNTAQPTTWTSYTAAGQDIVKTDATAGNWYLWTNVTDIAGNRADSVKVSQAYVVNENTTTDNKITLTANPTAWTKGNVTVTVGYGKNLSENRKAGVGSASVANAASVIVTEQNQTVYAEATDAAGNKVTATLKISNIDRTLPTTTITPNGGKYVLPTGGTNATLKAKLTAADVGSGLKTVQYAWSTSQTVEPTTWTNYTAAGQDIIKTDATKGNWYLWTKVIDQADNRATNIKVSNAFVVGDSTSQDNVITLTPNLTSWTNQNVVVTVTYGANLSQNRKAGIGSASTANATTVTVTAQNQVVYAEATDIAGNKITASLKISNIDKIAPTTTISPDGGQYIVPTGATTSTLKTRLTATDTGGSGLKTVQYAWSQSNTVEPSTWSNYAAAGEEVTKTGATEGNWYVWTKVMDVAGSRAQNVKVSQAFVVNDPNAAANRITLKADKTGWTNTDVMVTVTYGANISQNRKAGIQGQTLVNDTTSVRVSVQNQVAYAEGTDPAGNKVIATLKISNIDKVKPTTTMNPNGGNYVVPTGKTVATLTSRITAADTGGSNLKTVQYAWSTSPTDEALIAESAWQTFTASGQDVVKTDATRGDWYLWTRVVDNAGNRAESIKVSAKFSVVDTASIQIVPNTTNWTKNDVIAQIQYDARLTQNKKAGIQGQTLSDNATAVTVTTQNQTVYAEATDAAGNKIIATLKISNIDKTLPTAGISPNGGQYVIPTGASKATLKARLTAADVGSGLATVQYAWSNSSSIEPTAWTNYTASGQDITKTDAGVGDWYLWTKVVDNVGNRATSIKVSNKFTVNDTSSTANKITLTANPVSWTKGNVVVSVGYGANLSQNRKAGVGAATTANATSVTVTTQNQTVYAEATDIAGNKVTATLKISNIDRTLPTTTMEPNGGQYVIPTGMTSAVIRSQVTAADAGGSGLATVQFAWSNSNTVEPTTGWQTFTATGQQASKTDASEGSWYLWTKVVDGAGNRADNIKVSNAFVVNDPDAEASRITLTPNLTGWTNQNVSVSVTYGANLSQNRKAGIKGTTLAAGATVITVTTQGQVAYAEATDIAGNKVTRELPIQNIDKVLPTAGISPNGGQYVLPTGKTQATLKTRITAADTGGSNLNVVQYAWSNSNTTEPTTWTNYVAAGQDVTKTDATKGNWYLWTKVIDKAGNQNTAGKVSSAFVVGDGSITLTPNPTTWTNGSVVVGVTYSANVPQNRKAGIKGGTLTANASSVTVGLQNQTVRAEATDAAGNLVYAEKQITNIDKTAPTAAISPNGGNYVLPTGKTQATLKARVSATDTGGSGLSTVQYAWSNSNTTEPTTGWTNYTAAGQDITKTDATKGNWYLWTKVIDAAGNRNTTGKVSNAFIVNDSSAGENNITLTPNNTAWTNQNVTVAVTYGANLSQNRKAGIKGGTLTANATTIVVGTQNQIARAEATDAAGNLVYVERQITNIDKINPTAGISPNGGQYIIPTGTTTATLKTRITAADTGGSGLKTVQYVWSNSPTAEPTTGWANFTAAGQEVTKPGATEGNWYLWTKVIDNANNRAETIKVSAAFVVNDPSAEANRITLVAPTAWTNQNVTVTVKYGANVTQNRKAGIQGGTLTANATKVIVGTQNQVAYAEGTDAAGNKVVATLQIGIIDKIAPTAGISPNGGQYVLPTGANVATLRTRLTAADTGGSGLSTVQYAWSNSNTTEPTTGWTNFTAAGQDIVKTDATVGNWYLWTKVTDRAGNRAATIKISAAFVVNDTTSTDNKITLTRDTINWTNGTVVVNVAYGKNLTTNRKAGIKGGTLTANALTVPITVQNQIAYAEATDAAGNKVTAELLVNNIDKTAPTVSLSPDGGKYTVPNGGSVATVKTKISVADTGGSGLKTVQYAWSSSNTAKPTTGWVNFTPPTFDLTETNMAKGSHYLWLNIIDQAGNTATKMVSGDFNVGTASIILTKNPTAMTNGNVTVAVNYGDILTQNRKAGVGSANTAGATSVTVTSNNTVYAEATDIAGNKVTANVAVTNIDKIPPTLNSLNVISPATGTYSAGTEITIRATYSEPIKGTVPTLKIKFGTGSERTMTPTVTNITTPTATIDYKYKIVNGDNGALASTAYTGTITDAVGNALAVANRTLGGNAITANTVPLKVSGFAVTSPATGTYKAGQVVTIVATWSEKLAGTPPTLKIRFGSGTERTMTTGAINGSTVSYTYAIAAGDNGALALTNYSGGAITDIYGNVGTPELKPLTGNTITADTTAPTVSAIAVTSPATGTYKAGTTVTLSVTWSENIKGTAPTLTLKFGSGAQKTATAGAISGNKITYTCPIAAGDNGVLSTINYTGGSISDIAGNVGTATVKAISGNTITADTVAPVLNSIAATSPATGTYKAGQVVTLIATWSENIKGTAPSLKIKFGSSAERTIASGTISGNTITYQYTIAAGDNGALATTAYTGGSITDGSGNAGAIGNKPISGNAITADTTAPTCNITANVGSPTNASSITYTFRFSENVTGFVKEDITVTNGTITSFSGSGATYTAVISNPGTITQSVSVAAGKCTDGVGNANVASNTLTINIDRTAPVLQTINVTSPAKGTYKAGQVVTMVATWSKNIKGTAPTLQIQFGGSALRNVAGTISGNTITYQYTIAAGDNGLLASKAYSGGSITDTVGNAGSPSLKALGGNAITADTTAPTCAITANVASPTNASSITYTFKFSENVTGFAADDITVTNGTKGVFAGSGSTYTLVVTNTGSTTQSVVVPAGKCTDAVGNANVASNTITITVDRTAPVVNTIAVTAPAAGTYKAGQVITMKATWSENIKGTAPTLKVKFGSGTERSITSGTVSGNTVTYTYTIAAGDNGILTTTAYTGGSITDIAGNAGTATNKTIGGNQITADTTAPTCTVTANVGSATNASSITYTFTFSENVFGFNADDVTVTNGTKGTFAGSGNVYTLVVTNPGTTTQSVSVPAGKCTDGVGNSNVASNTLTIQIDRSAPVLEGIDVMSPGTGTYKAGTTVTIAATWNKSIKGTAPTLKIKFGSGAEKTISSGTISGNKINYTYTIAAGDNGLLTATAYSGGSITDLVGNAGSATLKRLDGYAITADTTAPTCKVTANVGSLTNASSITYTFTFSEAVTGFAADDVTVQNGTKSTFAGSGTTYTLVVTNGGSTAQSVSVPAGKCTDAVGNGNVASNTVSITIDRTKPTCTVATNSPNPTNATSITCTFTFSESVTGFTKEDILLNTGTVTSFSGSGSTYTAVIGNLGNVTLLVSVDANKCTDAAGNGNAASNSISITIDREQPYPRVDCLSNTNPTNATSVNYKIVFTKSVIGFTKEDIAVTNGTVTSLTGSGTTYTATISNNGTGNQEVYVKANTCTDVLGNTNRESNHTTLTIDRTPPYCMITANVTSPTNASSITYTIKFSENVKDFIYTDVTITNGFLSSFNGSGSTYTVVVSNSGSTTQSISVGAGKCTDSAGNGNLASDTLSMVIDRTAPILSVTANRIGPTGDSTITYTFRFNEAVNGFGAEDITVTNGTKGTLSPSSSPNTYTMVVTTGNTGTMTLTVAANACTDAAGNGNAAVTHTLEIDKVKPTCTITANVNSPTNASSITYTFKFSKNVTGFTASDVTVTNGTKGTFSGNGTTYTLVVTNTGSCSQTISVAAGTCIDLAGNANTSASKVMTIDRTGPVITATPASDNLYQWFKEAKINASDAGGSGLNSSSIKYVWSSNATALPETSITQTIANGGLAGVYSGISTGKIYLHMLAKDNAGNTSIVVSGPYYIDATPPVGTISLTPGTTSTQLILKINVTDAHSGISVMGYELYTSSGQYITGGNTTANTVTITGLTQNTAYKVKVKITDKCLNSLSLEANCTTKARALTSDKMISQAWGGYSHTAGTCQFFDTAINLAVNQTWQRGYDDGFTQNYTKTVNVRGAVGSYPNGTTEKVTGYRNLEGKYTYFFNYSGLSQAKNVWYLPKYLNAQTVNKRLYKSSALDNNQAWGRIAASQNVNPAKCVYSIIFRVNNGAANASNGAYYMYMRKMFKIASGDSGVKNGSYDGYVKLSQFQALDTIGRAPAAPVSLPAGTEK